MKKRSKVVSKIVGMMLLAVMLVGCGSLPFLSKSSQGDLEVVSFDLPEHRLAVSYVDYDQIIVGRNDQYANDPRYADVTPDGLVDWTKNQTFEENEKTLEYLEKVTLNGKKIQLPMTFSELDPAYQAFDSMDTREFQHDGDKLALQNKTNQTKLLVYGDLKASMSEPIFASIVRMNKHQISVYYREKTSNTDNEVVGLYSALHVTPAEMDLRIDGIGIGNTFNEMYEKFGKPTSVLIGGKGYKIVRYSLEQDVYNITFYTIATIFDPSSDAIEIPVYSNVITKVEVIKNDR